jgi:single-stranded-DNA-specific exonuclease
MEQQIDLLIKCNTRRKQVQEEIFQRCLEIARNEMAEDRFLLLVPENGHEGVAGNVAGKIKEALYKPTVVFTRGDNGLLKGSGRSIDGINIYDELKKNESMFQAFGGHAAACGLTLREESLPALRKALSVQMEEIWRRDPDVFVEKKRADLELQPKDVTMDMAEQLAMLEPCGMGNEKPKIAVTGRVAWPRRIGKEGQFLRFQIVLEDGNTLQAVTFRDADGIEEMASVGQLQFLGNLTVNEWEGRRKLQFVAEEAVKL